MAMAATPRRRILACDDDPDMTRLIKRSLTFHSFEVTELNDPRQLVPTLEQGAFDLLVLDLMMPDVDGEEVVSAVRGRTDALKDLPIVVLTAKDCASPERARLQRARAFVVEKPLVTEDLVRRIREALASRGA